MIFRQLFEPVTSSYTYLVACPRTREAVLIDPVDEEVDAYVALLESLDLKLKFTLETHVHADHVTGASRLRDRLGSRAVLHHDAGVACADVLVRGGDVVAVGDLEIVVRETPGHTAADVSYVMADRVFTGDALLIGGCGRTDFQHGDAGRLYDALHAEILSLPGDTLVYPAHDYKGRTVSTVAEERAQNARLGGGRTREDFVRLMGELDLPKPKHIDRALPANQRCGRAPEQDAAALEAASTPDPAGFRRIAPDAVARHLYALRVIDVREPEELAGPLGSLEGADNVPLGRVVEAARGWKQDRPLLVVCRSGGRSTRAAAALARMGFTVYELAGGMLAWKERRPAARGVA